MSGRTLRRSVCNAALAATLAVAAAVDAQIIVVPSFPVGPSPLAGRALNTEVAVGADGSILFAWTNNGTDPFVAVRRMSAGGLVLGPPRTPVGQLGYARGLSADASGGYALVSDDLGLAIGGIRGRFLDVLGVEQAGPFVVSDAGAGGVQASSVASLPGGTVFAWVEAGLFYARLYDLAGTPRGPSILVSPGPAVAGQPTISVAARPGGGFVVAWAHTMGSIVTSARVYDANGVPETGVITVATGAFGTAVAASPLGGFMVSAFRFGAGVDGSTEVVAFRVGDDGAPLGSTHAALLPSGMVGLSDVAFDSVGNALVAWSEYQFVGPTPGYLANRGRGVAADGTALSRPFLIAAPPVDQVRTAVLANDTFVNAWVSDGDVLGSIVRLCTASVAVCGDGVTVAGCEECDDGAGNSDTTPDACRTDCSLPRCGDGLADLGHGEECDDQNSDRCDGCTPECRLEVGLVCGDGAVVAGCGDEQCDDANAIAGDGCASTCTLEAIPGGGGAGTDCITGFTVDNPANDPLLDKRGAFNATQVCTDDDPRCDFDGGVVGGCTFEIRACASVTSLERCTPPTRLGTWTLVQPSDKKAARHPELAAVRAALAPVPGALVGPDQRDVCSARLAVRVPLRGVPGALKSGKLALKTSATTYEGGRDNDKLKLVCVPAS